MFLRHRLRARVPFLGGASTSNERPSMEAPLQIPKGPKWCCPPCRKLQLKQPMGLPRRVGMPPSCSLPHLVTLSTEATLLLPCGSGMPRGIRAASASSCSNPPPHLEPPPHWFRFSNLVLMLGEQPPSCPIRLFPLPYSPGFLIQPSS